MTKRVAVLVYVNVDPKWSGWFDTKDSALEYLKNLFMVWLGHYNPTVDFAPDRYNLPNDPNRKTFLVYTDLGMVPAEKVISEVLHYVITRTKPYVITAPDSLQPDNNEGNN